MREILFKAKRLYDGECFEGVPVDVTPLQCFSEPQTKKVVMICAGFADWGMPRGFEFTNIDPETVCEYTGITDKNGIKIFECDKVRVCLNPEIKTGVVRYNPEIACFCIDFDDGFVTFLDLAISKRKVNDKVWIEVVGNIHDTEVNEDA